jgi:hypothetical protein
MPLSSGMLPDGILTTKITKGDFTMSEHVYKHVYRGENIERMK